MVKGLGVCTYVRSEAREGCQIAWSQSYQWLWATRCKCREPNSSLSIPLKAESSLLFACCCCCACASCILRPASNSLWSYGWLWTRGGGGVGMWFVCPHQCQRRKPSVLSYSCPSVNLELGLQPVSPGDPLASTSHSTQGYGRFQGRRCQSGPMPAQHALWLTKTSSQPRPWPSRLRLPRAATSTPHYAQFNYSFRVPRATYPILLGLASC